MSINNVCAPILSTTFLIPNIFLYYIYIFLNLRLRPKFYSGGFIQFFFTKADGTRKSRVIKKQSRDILLLPLNDF